MSRQYAPHLIPTEEPSGFSSHSLRRGDTFGTVLTSSARKDPRHYSEYRPKACPQMGA
jgi:hypothetical protein